MCIGDLNFVLDQSEKQGGSLVASSSSCPFKKFIDHFGLVDLTKDKGMPPSKKDLTEA
jgi:hypothetical protein